MAARTEVARARRIVCVRPGYVQFLEKAEAKRRRTRERRAIERGNFDALARVEPRRGIAWFIY